MVRSVAIRATLASLALAGIFLGYVLTRNYYLHVIGGEASSCAISAYVDCDRVSSSAWASVAGVPVSAFGLGFHFMIFGLLVMTSFTSKEEVQRAIGGLLTILLGAGSVVSLLYAGIALFAVGALCVFCTALQVVTIAAFVVLAVALRGGIRDALRSIASAQFLRSPALISGAIVLASMVLAITTAFGLEQLGVDVMTERELSTRPDISIRSRYFDPREAVFDISR